MTRQNKSHSLLHGTELDANDELALARHALQYVCLQSTQQMRSQHVVQLLNLFLLRDVCELVEEALEIPASRVRSVVWTKRQRLFDWPVDGPYSLEVCWREEVEEIEEFF